MYNRKFTETHKERISQAMKGKKHTEQTKQKISNAIKQRWAEATPQPTTKPTQPTQPTQPTK